MECSAALEQAHVKWKQAVAISEDIEDRSAVRQLESAMALYLRRVSSKHDVSPIVQVSL